MRRRDVFYVPCSMFYIVCHVICVRVIVRMRRDDMSIHLRRLSRRGLSLGPLEFVLVSLLFKPCISRESILFSHLTKTELSHSARVMDVQSCRRQTWKRARCRLGVSSFVEWGLVELGPDVAMRRGVDRLAFALQMGFSDRIMRLSG